MKTITLPRSVVVKVLKASSAFEAMQTELEDYLIASDPRAIRALRKARREHLARKVRPFRLPL